MMYLNTREEQGCCMKIMDLIVISDAISIAQKKKVRFLSEKGYQFIDDVIKVNNSKKLRNEEKRLTNVRLNQWKFRKEIEKLWGGRCASSGCDLSPILRASHIVPWRDANDEERIDKFNGLLLEARFDALFDRGLISFDNEGHILTSSRISEKTIDILGLKGLRLTTKLNDKHIQYLNRNRKLFEKEKTNLQV